MLAMEEILCELGGDDMNNEQGLPPGFRFHPTDEELITFYLASKVLNGSFCGVDIAEVDLNRCEPWELPDAAKMGEREWYFFSLRDRKYPTGLRTNRATCAGYWKATGKDREVYSSGSSGGALVGMKKTLVFYKGRAPRGEKTKWVMHEYRLDADFFHRHTCKEEWVICRIFHKIGEKKNLLLQGQSHLNLIKGCSSPSSGLLPPLLEAPTTLVESQCQEGMESLQNPLLMHHNQQESYLKSLINPVFSHFNLPPLSGSPPSFPPITNTTTTVTATNKDADDSSYLSPTTSLLKAVLNGHEKCTLKGVTNAISKQCKTETSFPFYQSSNGNMPWADKTPQSTTNQSHAAPTTPFWADFMGFPSVTDHTVREMPVSSASVAFNRGGFQMLLDPPIADSWPLYF